MIFSNVPEALGIAISPLPIIAILVILMSKRAKTNGAAFAAGWILAVTVLTFVVLGIAEGGDVGRKHEPNHIAAIIQLVLGFVLLFFAGKNWAHRPRKGQRAPTPKWLASIDTLPVSGALGLAFMLGALNVKNIPLTTTAMLDVAEANAGPAQTYASIAMFIVISSLSICLPLLFYLCSPKASKRLFTRCKIWLTQHNSVILAGLFALLSVKTIYEAIHKLS